MLKTSLASNFTVWKIDLNYKFESDLDTFIIITLKRVISKSKSNSDIFVIITLKEFSK